mmetsp:Transcript_52806/g.123517  ORF Transcript_52806/g.123517 Transcript_52806/m.123517 type:complete len:482 (-) Transcript_52806:52-1497(-)
MRRAAEPVGGPPPKAMKMDPGRRGGGGGGGGKGLGPVGRHVFKVLCTDPLAANVIGHGGQSRAELEQATGCSVWISKREELFPEPHMRLLVLHAPQAGSVQAALERLVPKLIEVADRDRTNGEDTSLLGKEDGEYVFYCALPVSVRGRLIAQKGKEISMVRERSGAKIFVENESFDGHCSTRVIGREQNIVAALGNLNNLVQEEASQPGFVEWAETKPFNAAARGVSLAGGGSGGSGGGGGGGGGGGQKRLRPRSDPRGGGGRPPRDDHRGDGGKGPPAGGPPPLRGQDLDEQTFQRFVDDVPVEGPPLETIGVLSELLEADEVQAEHQISFCLPLPLGEQLHGFIQERSGCMIHVHEKENQPEDIEYTIQGPLLNTYLAHLLVMKTYHEEERRKREELAREAEMAQAAEPVSSEAPQDVDFLRAQIETLQAQLAAAQGGGGGPMPGFQLQPPLMDVKKDGAHPATPRGQWGTSTHGIARS